MHPGLDGKPSGACPTLYYRDTVAAYSGKKTLSLSSLLILKMIVLPRQARDKHRESTQNKRRVLLLAVRNVSTYRLWVALEAASGILSEHQHSPSAVFGQQFGSWNVSADPYLEDGKESPLWAFARSRALNRLALRTKLKVTATLPPPAAAAQAISTDLAGLADHRQASARSDPIVGFTVYEDSNCYHAPHGGVALPRTGAWLENQTAASCAALCTADEKCDCVTFQARPGSPDQHKSQYQCWPRCGTRIFCAILLRIA